jgi:hypothetical protein
MKKVLEMFKNAYAVSSFQLSGFVGDSVKFHFEVGKIIGVLGEEDMSLSMNDLSRLINDCPPPFSRPTSITS